MKEIAAKNANKARLDSARQSLDEQTTVNEATKSFTDWDRIDAPSKTFIIASNRIASDAVVYLTCEQAIESAQEALKVATGESNLDKTQSKATNSSYKDIRRSNSDDVFLSDDDEETKSNESRKNSVSSAKLVEIAASEDLENGFVSAAATTVLKYPRKPSISDCFFNLYENLPKETLVYISKNEFTIVPTSFLAYCDTKRKLKTTKLKLARTDRFKVLWLCLTLDLAC